jgi:uncharacterized damage-inducible protein DinB
MRPEKKTYPDYYEMYIPLVEENNVVDALQKNLEEIRDLVTGIPSAKGDHAYAGGKWTVKQVLNHMADTERIISYRALRFARKDPQQPLAFEENDYAVAAELSSRSIRQLLEEIEAVRNATLSLFKSFSKEVLLQKGTTSFGQTTVLALGFLIAGHTKHHMNVLKSRYL